MNYYHDIWVGFLTGVFVKKCLELSVFKCPGCKDKVKSPLLHLHLQQSLLQKIKSYFNEAQAAIIPKLDQLFDTVQHKLPSSDNPVKDKEIYTNNARIFIHTATAEMLYYGRFVNETNDCIIHEIVNCKANKKRKIETQNDSVHIQNSFKKKQKVHQEQPTQSVTCFPSNQMNQPLSSQPVTYTPNRGNIDETTSSQPTTEFDLSEFFYNC